MNEGILGILGTIMLVSLVFGLINYKTLRAKWSNVIGIPGCYVVCTGIMMLFSLIGSLFSGDHVVDGAGEWIASILFILLCLGYMVIVMLRLPTVKQRVMLPFAAYLIGVTFCWKVVWAIFTHSSISGSSGEEMPNIIYDDTNTAWYLQYKTDNGEAEYNDHNGNTVHIYHSDVSGSSAQTSAGNFHWY